MYPTLVQRIRRERGPVEGDRESGRGKKEDHLYMETWTQRTEARDGGRGEEGLKVGSDSDVV